MSGISVAAELPQTTLAWLLGEDIPQVAVLTRRTLLDEPGTPETEALWAWRNEYEPVRRILEAQRDDGSWEAPERDYAKYGGNLWQVLFLGELWADPSDERVRRAADYAFSRQMDSGGWAVNGKKSYTIQCLTANVARSLARLGFASDERVLCALGWLVDEYERGGVGACGPIAKYTLKGYCHMMLPKVLLFLAEVPRESWPKGAERLKDACVAALRDKEVLRCQPTDASAFGTAMGKLPSSDRTEFRERFLAQHQPLEYADKTGWLKFGFPLTYNSDALEALFALAAVGETARPEYDRALGVVRSAADPEMRWTMRNTFNGKMIADVESKNAPSKWLTLRALTVLRHFG